MPSSTFIQIQNDGAADLQAEKEALAKEESALRDAAQRLSARKVAEARQKVAETRQRLDDAALPAMPPGLTAPIPPTPPAGSPFQLNFSLGDDAPPREVKAIQGTPQVSKPSDESNHMSEAVPIVAIVFCFGWLSIKAIVNAFTARGASRQALRLSAEEQAVVEKLQRTLAQMESRVESLETILVETRRSKESYGAKF